jgi:hypothetical protein
VGSSDSAAVLAGQLRGNALGDDPVSPGRGRRGEQVTGALTAHPVVAGTEVRQVGGLVGQVGELVKDHLGTEPSQGLDERVTVEDVADNGLGGKPAK